MTRIGPAIALEDILEADWQRSIVGLAKQLNWLVYHTYNSRRSQAGFPDLVLVRDRVVFVEVKREKSRLTDDQEQWFHALRAAGIEVYVWRPSDLSQVGEVLARRVKREAAA